MDPDGKFVRRENGVIVFNFSDHSGKTVDEVARADAGFLEWMLRKDFLDEAKAVAREALARQRDQQAVPLQVEVAAPSRLTKTHEGSASLMAGDTSTVTGPTDVGTGRPRQEDKATCPRSSMFSTTGSGPTLRRRINSSSIKSSAT